MSKQRREDEAILHGIFAECLNPVFLSWWNKVYPSIEVIRDKKFKAECNYSVITFSIHEFPDFTIGKKVAIGTLRVLENFDKHLVDFFWILRNICPEAYKYLIDKENPAFLGIGLECHHGLKMWKFYVGLPAPKCEIYAVTCLGKQVVEKKHYKYDSKYDTMMVKGRVERIQPNIEVWGEKAQKFLKWLLQTGYISKNTYMLAKGLSDYLLLDTISVSERGVALYFE